MGYKKATACTYTVKNAKDSGVCLLRLDYETFDIRGPNLIPGVGQGQCNLDTWTIATETKTGK